MSKKPVIKRCERCGKEFGATSNYVHFCEECSIIVKQEKRDRNNEARLIAKQKKLIETGVENIDYVIDRWNGLPTTRIPGRWFNERHPGKTIEEYIAEFPDAPLVCEKTSKKISDNTTKSMNRPEVKKLFSERFSGDRNPNAKCNTTEEQRKSISPFSKSFKGYDGLSDEEKSERIREYLGSDRDDRTTSQIGYWTSRGYSEDEARDIISERQKTFTLDKCIEKYGEDKGKEVWENRQKNWLESLYDNFTLSGDNRTPMSKFEMTCTRLICEYFNIEIPKKQRYISDKFGNHFSYDLTIGKKIIEFNGDYWHMNPEIYSKDSYNKTKKMSASEIWEHDALKIQCAEYYGYQVMTVWESEYNKDKEGTIQKCIDFLKQQL